MDMYKSKSTFKPYSFKPITKGTLLSRNDYVCIMHADRISNVIFKINYYINAYLWLWYVSGHISFLCRRGQNSVHFLSLSNVSFLLEESSLFATNFVCKSTLLFQTYSAQKEDYSYLDYLQLDSVKVVQGDDIICHTEKQFIVVFVNLLYYVIDHHPATNC